jgi:hypothetical protein
MRDGATTHTKQRLSSVSLVRALDAAERASRWEAGAPVVRGPARSDLDGDGVRPHCALGARLGVPVDNSREEVA